MPEFPPVKAWKRGRGSSKNSGLRFFDRSKKEPLRSMPQISGKRKSTGPRTSLGQIPLHDLHILSSHDSPLQGTCLPVWQYNMTGLEGENLSPGKSPQGLPGGTSTRKTGRSISGFALAACRKNRRNERGVSKISAMAYNRPAKKSGEPPAFVCCHSKKEKCAKHVHML